MESCCCKLVLAIFSFFKTSFFSYAFNLFGLLVYTLFCIVHNVALLRKRTVWYVSYIAIILYMHQCKTFNFCSISEYENCHRHIVCYCTVGYRSSMTAQLLSDYLCCETNQNFITSSMIYNLQGGLVKWASEKRWMIDQYNKPSSKMHPYNEVWAKLLEPEFKVETTEKV